ncbi:MAG: hypothetical protein ACFHWZ_05205 [Phycisphaerales bacterium]
MSHDASDNLRTFVDRWKNSGLTERASAQSHFNDLCDVLGVPRPTDQRETDSTYGFEAMSCKQVRPGGQGNRVCPARASLSRGIVATILVRESS